MTSMNDVPAPMADWLASLPSDNVGSLYATVTPPLIGIPVTFKVKAWGQLCDGRDHRDAVHIHLYNHFPNRGKGWTYRRWEARPDNPESNRHPGVYILCKHDVPVP